MSANYDGIVSWVLRFEDATLSGTITDLPGDTGGKTRFGIASHSHPEVPAEFYTTMPTPDALVLAKGIYKTEYWDKMGGDWILDDQIASVLMDFAVNSGLSRAVKTVQRLLGISADGVVGLRTLTFINGAGSELAIKLRQVRLVYLGIVAQNNPQDEKFLANWTKRAMLVYPDNGGL